MQFLQVQHPSPQQPGQVAYRLRRVDLKISWNPTSSDMAVAMAFTMRLSEAGGRGQKVF